MRAIIAGAGDVGFHLASRLSQQGEEIVVIDPDQEKVDRVSDHLDVLALQGSGVDFRMLDKAGIARSDMVIAVTDDDEVNIMVCQLARRYGVGLKIARVGADCYYGDSPLSPREDLGIDVMVNPEVAAAEQVVRLLRLAPATDVAEFAEGEVMLIGLRIGESFPHLDRPLREIAGEFEARAFLVAAISRGDQTIIPGGQDLIRRGDLLYVIGRSEAVPDILRLTGHSDRPLQRVMLAGGTRTAVLTARRLEERGVSPIIFEASRARCAELAEELTSTLVLNGDATDLDLLQSEGVDGVDGFVALTGDEENNIISCLVARNMGAGKVIARIRRIEYINLAHRIGIDATVSPHLSTVNAILSAANSDRLIALATMRGLSAQIMEVSIKAGLPYVGKPLRELRLPSACILGSVVRDGRVFIPHGSDHLEPGDKAVIFTLAQQARKVSKYFL